ncbi:NAD-dependent epimerase/dehydratase family protein [Terrimonas rubra]|uniref:NAD-dependent epimerase/dehydratase family protein n=1 Tax=Terrimonas rubra TaxID=1035890 RepID=A0ABW6A622_9BACT
MVIGNGLVAHGFEMYQNNDQVVVFASGVSNSNNTDRAAFDRETDLLNDTLSGLQTQLVIYISTCSIYDPSMQASLYVHHKLAMEKLVADKADNYYIFRVPNLAGHTSNPHTTLNFLFNHIVQGIPFHIWKNASRNIIDIEDAVRICNHFISSDKNTGRIINIANQFNYPVVEIVEKIERATGRKGIYTVIDKGNTPVIDITEISPVINKLGINFAGNYLDNIIQKYLVPHDL